MRIRIPNSLFATRCSAARAVGTAEGDPLDRSAPHVGFRRQPDAPVGPKLREHRIGQENLRMAFPEKSDEEIETHPERRLGQSRPHRHRIRPSRPHLGSRSGQARHRPYRILAGDARPLHPAARRRQAGAGLRRASGELGNAGSARRGAWPAERRALPRAQYRRRRRHGAQYARREYGPADQDRPRRADEGRRRARRRQACRHAGRPILCARRAGDVLRARRPWPIR